MSDEGIKNILKNIGIPLGIVSFFIIIGIIFYLWKNYLESQKLRLEISELKNKILLENDAIKHLK